jgi:hypothetical protein
MYNHSSPSVVVNKGGPITALVKGVFLTLITILICATAIGLFGLRIADRWASQAIPDAVSSVGDILESIPDWQNMPPAVADVLNDRRDYGYAENLDVETRLVRGGAHGERGNVIVEITNRGDEVVSLLTMLVTIEDESDQPVLELKFAGATPLQIEDEWRGPLPPGQTRKFARRVYEIAGDASIGHSITDLRVWNGPLPPRSDLPAPAVQETVAAH